MGERERMPRRYERQAPKHTVQVTAELEGLLALGEALDLSAGGACVVLQSREFMVGDEVILWLSFARPRQPVPATGRVVWAGGAWDQPRYGLEWTHQGPQRSWIGWAAQA
jgi:PilZ domain